MTKEEYCKIRDAVYKNAGMDKFDFDLMMHRIVTKAVEAEREECAKLCEKADRYRGDYFAAQIRARGQA